MLLLWGAVVVMVTVAGTAEVPGVTCWGETVHAEREGHARETGNPKRPSLGLTLTVNDAVCPAVMLALPGVLLRSKSRPAC